jgi:hypothetical protein
MLDALSGGRETALAVQESIGKTIAGVALADDALRIALDSGVTLTLTDNGQSCCENRYMTCGDLDNADYYRGATLVSVETRGAPSIEDEGGEHEVQFLLVTTSKGVITAETHNEHNGYYGGFSIQARLVTT